MPAERRRRRSLLALLALLSLVLLTMDFRQGDDGPIASVQRGLGAVFAPVQDGLASAVEPIGNMIGSIGDLGRLREENVALEEELRELRARQLSLADLAQENAELREQLGMKLRLDHATTAGRVIAQPPGLFRWSLLLDIGAEQGVRPNMAVINADGLVGKITEVSRNHARVQLAVSPNAGYFVRVVETRQQGFLEGRGSRPMQLRIIDDPEAEIPEGAEVVTRAFQGTSIPDGLPVGMVDEAPGSEIGGAQFLGVRPYVDHTRLDIVLVILDAPEVPADVFDDVEEDELDDPGAEDFDEDDESAAARPRGVPA